MLLPPIPIPVVNAPPPASAVEKLEKLKYCVIGLWACGIGRIGFGDPWGGITSMMAAIAGTFMLREDPTISKCHACLMETPLAVCGARSGMACLVPMMMYAGISGIFDFIKLCAELGAFGVVVLEAPVVFVLAGSVVFEIASMLLCWWVWKDIMGGGTTGGGGGAFGGGGVMSGGYAPPGHPANPERAERSGTQMQNFQAFQGQGQRLGDGSR